MTILVYLAQITTDLRSKVIRRKLQKAVNEIIELVVVSNKGVIFLAPLETSPSFAKCDHQAEVLEGHDAAEPYKNILVA